MIAEPTLVSVIIPTHNRKAFLRQTLDALGRQTYPNDFIQVVVIADHCTDATLDMLGSYVAPYTLCFGANLKTGPAEARNYGARVSLGELLIFLDDDIEVVPEFIQAHVNAHRAGANQVVIGYLPPVISDRSSFFSLELRGAWEEKFHTMRQPGRRFNYTDLLSGNFSIRRELFQQTDGFSTAFRVHEDYEFGMRLIQRGAIFVFAEAAMGYHHESTDLERSLERKLQEGIADVQLGQRYPELIPSLVLWRLLHHSLFPSRFMRFLKYRLPQLGDLLAHISQRSLSLFQWLHFVGTWRKIFAGLVGYWYWKGVTQVLATPKALEDFLQLATDKSSESRETKLRLDLSTGLEEVECLLDQEQPESAEIYYGEKFLSYLYAVPGTERWRGTHLRPFLIVYLGSVIPATLREDEITQLPARIDQLSLFLLTRESKAISRAEKTA